jgi:hypothetical protein
MGWKLRRRDREEVWRGEQSRDRELKQSERKREETESQRRRDESQRRRDRGQNYRGDIG